MNNKNDESNNAFDNMVGIKEMEMSSNLFHALLHLKQTDTANGRLWAIAATEAEKLHAWIMCAFDVANDLE